MAKKIILSFLGQPQLSNGLSYNISISGTPIVYENGLSTLDVKYRAFGLGNLSPNEIEIQLSLSNTIDNTLSFLANNYTYSNIFYVRKNNTIEVIINTSLPINISFGSFDPNITQSVLEIPETENINLKYFFQYKNIVNDEYRCEIYNKQYFGNATEIKGRATIEKGSVKDHLEPIRGTGLSLDLEASTALTLEDLYSENEQDFTVRLYKNGRVLFIGFLKPDGIYQSFTRDIWTISLDCIDGLGAISNLSFVRPNGVRFVDKMSAIDIAYNCLKRTGISLPINTSINTIYDGLVRTPNMDVLAKIKLNADRFFRVDGQNTGDGTIMSCEEVLKSVLDLFCACITQINGEWYIYKPNELFLTDYPLFRRYDIRNNYTGNVTLNIGKVLGSQINNFYPYHCSGNQKIDIKGGVSAFRVNYKYGFVSGLLSNPSIIHDGNLNYQGWILNNQNISYLINDPLSFNGFKMTPDIHYLTDSTPIKLLATSESVLLNKGTTFNFKITLKANGSAMFYFRIRQGSYSMKQDGSWVLNNSIFPNIELPIYSNDYRRTIITNTYDINSGQLPNNGNVFVEIYVAKNMANMPVDATLSEVSSLDLINISAGDNVVGEFNTVERATKISTIVKENKVVYNGDNDGIVYIGAIFKENGIDTTSLWNREKEFTSKPILQIAAEEELRISQKPLKKFTGSTFGHIPYLSIIKIDNISGKFMPIEYSYDTFSNISTIKSLELFASEISDLVYNKTFDYGETVKPTIKG
jgi:hypothetical protein